ncbi:ATP-binding cassette domain-containing protein [Halomonas sp. EGI 63088]|uniref:ATP-binding cassette domain-containing protein n=1 Tax=Halomonas flagellata TaxID=2920385 RepID=A0ABS9RRM3_9GAMM|nr:ATP-binding cassette domain-containing protein [Halomonas flagellata]MCH4562471.1 ATP-binding cassette domain-containing protein [Halomonas flagellata]
MLELCIEARMSRQPVLGDIATRIAEGDRICLLGPSGIGKTTLLNVIVGLEQQFPAAAVRRRAGLRIGYLFQEHRLLPWRTLRQNLRLVGVPAHEVEPLLAQVGLAGCAEHLPDQLSLGMARRAALARCLAIQPDLLLLDEPFASLDPPRAQALQNLVGTLLDARPHMAMICVTHDARDAGRLANRIWYLNGQPARLEWDERLASGADVAGITRKLRSLESKVV